MSRDHHEAVTGHRRRVWRAAWVVLVGVGVPAAAFNPHPMVELVASAVVGGCAAMCWVLARQSDARWRTQDAPLEVAAGSLAATLALCGLFTVLGGAAIAVVGLGCAVGCLVAEAPRLPVWGHLDRIRRRPSLPSSEPSHLAQLTTSELLYGWHASLTEIRHATTARRITQLAERRRRYLDEIESRSLGLCTVVDESAPGTEPRPPDAR